MSESLPNQSNSTPVRSLSPLSGTILSSARHRPGYTRVASMPSMDEKLARQVTVEDEDDITNASNQSVTSKGLGILGVALESAETPKLAAIRTTPNHVLSSPALKTSDYSAPLLSLFNQSVSYNQQSMVSPLDSDFSGGSTQYEGSQGDIDSPPPVKQNVTKKSVSSFQSSLLESHYEQSDAGLDDSETPQQGKARTRIKRRMCSWLPITIITLAIISTLLSLAFVIIGMRGPRWGRMIGTNGSLTVSSAAFLTSFLAKLIELTFVTIAVAFVGQALARRAYRQKASKGVTIAEMTMRGWIMQPGTLFSHWESVKYASVTWLGVISIIATLAALLYTTAATALVQPQLKFPDWSPKIMQGLVKTEFANTNYINSHCKTPISNSYDPQYAGPTCIQLEHAAMGYHNYFGYLNTWSNIVDNGSGNSLIDLAQRPRGFALLNDNTTITAPWVEQTNVTDLYNRHDIIINNISMAMPHPGVAQAAVDPINRIMQPGDLDGLGSYGIRASVPSPVVHVLCATLNSTSLEPFIIANTSYNAGSNITIDPYLNGTNLDDIFGWGEAYGAKKWPPTFFKLPEDFNTVVNDTTGIPWGRDSIYILGKGGPADDQGVPTNDQNYALCSMKVSQAPYCSTQYNASTSGGTLEAVCEDPHDKMRYNESVTDAGSGNVSLSLDWPNIGTDWAKSLSLNDGVVDGNASNARLLTQLILTTPQLNPQLPSMAEALAVMSGCTLLISSSSAPLVEFWNYTRPSIEGQYQAFNASVRAQEYASGGTQNYQKAFGIVLFAVFFMNLLMLIYFIVHREWYVDFSEPTTLFSLAVNSPPSKDLAVSSGYGPRGDQLRVGWKVNKNGEHVYMESQVRDADAEKAAAIRRRQLINEGFEKIASPVKRASQMFELNKRR
ncbi:Hypothetical protein R9X50_00798300 [Acrodontium crateriforme]|uniref:Uncharacterized protein n=1 Tax=Acrodontium crateriforme TaxID=150365 RepID=A0AAQ3RB62_9PEZI|nr:Hypothetical protein R9X50_00798300 [Acrodontium crateriforme]